MRGHVPPVVARLTPKGLLPETTNLPLTLGLPLRNQSELDEFLRQLQDPHSTNYHKYLAPGQFAERFGPTRQQYQLVIRFAESNGFIVVGTDRSRMILDVVGGVSNVERAFQITLRLYRHPTEPREFYAPDTEPSVPANVPVLDVEGLSNFEPPHPLLHPARPPLTRPLSGSGPSGYFAGNDFRNAYVPGTTLTGSGQTVGLVEFSSYYQSDITNYENTIGMTNYVPLNNVVVGHPAPNANNNAEVALDIEVAIAMAPQLSKVIVYESSGSASSLLQKMATDDLAKQISCSWSWSGGPNSTIDATFKQMQSQGQTFFQASGDDDAYTGANALDNSSLTDAPVDSTNVIAVGGTTLTMNGSGASWSSEKVWNYHSYGGSYANTGSGGGISTYYTIPWWQTNVSMSANSGSTTMRNIPDVALTADQVFVDYNNGSSGGFAGTSCAAPLWAGFCALVNQASVAASGNSTDTVGFLNPAFYTIANSANYSACFHDTTTGNNIGTNTPGLFYAVTGYDLCTGLGTPTGTNLINALVPTPSILTPPASQTATNGNNVTFSVTAGGQSPLSYQWLFNGNALTSGGNISGATSSTLTIASVTSADAGNYNVVVTNGYGAATSSVAALTVVFPPTFTTEPTNQTVPVGGNAVFSATVAGASPLAYQWRQNGTNLLNGGNVSGATSNVLTLTSVTLGDAGNYTLVVTDLYGSATSSVATLTVTEPPTITVPPSSLTIQCGSNAAFSVTATGTAPLHYQWSLDGTAIAGATSTNLLLTGVPLPDHTVTVLVTNLYGSATSSTALVVQDTLPPVISLNSTNPYYVELGSAYTEPGASAYDLCMGVVPVTITGSVNTNVVGTNLVTYTAGDGNGNTNTVTRTVIVQDTTPPTIEWSFTNLVLAAGTNCSALLPDVTGTNFILATDLSGPLTITQSPTNGAVLPEGTNPVVLTVLDAYGNAAYSTNSVTVQDQSPPLIWNQPQSQTVSAGTNASFSLVATACTPLAYQWYFNNALLAGENNSTLTISNLDSTLAGDYFVVASAAGGSSTSAVAVLTVARLQPSLALASSENPTGYKDGIYFSASLMPTNATGSVEFLTNSIAFDTESLLAGLAASVTNDTLPRGTNFIAAVYSGDTVYLPATNLLAQIVTNHPPVAAPFSTYRYAGFTLYIPVANLSSNWSDPDGDTVSLVGIGVSTNGVTVTNDAGTLVYVNSNNVDDLFVCTVSDGWGGTNYQAVTVTVLPLPTNATPAITSVSGGTNNTVLLELNGGAGFTYILQATTNLAVPGGWLPLATNTLGTNGVWQFSAPMTSPQQFYRLELSQ
ncbi:MAG: immunoglobulin domain-containing protein [Verrucomicrobiota bacterium]|nr:immunoglobulin domain-containing protein [Verrucomicrobiota bacterium]